MTNNQKLMFGYFSIAGAVLNLYDDHLTKTASKLARTMKKQLKKLYQSNPVEYIQLSNKFNSVWNKAIDKYSGEKLEGMNFIVEVLSHNEELSKRYGVTEKLLTRFATLQYDDVAVDIEIKTRLMASDIIKTMFDELGIELPKKANLTMLKNKVRNELALSGLL